MSKLLCLDTSKKNRMFIPYDNIQYVSLTFNRKGATKVANVTLKNGEIISGIDAWFTTVEYFIGNEEEPQVKKIGF